MTFVETGRNSGVIPVVTLQNSDIAMSYAQALQRGGINIIEFTFRTNQAARCIESVRKEASLENFLVGAGSVYTEDDAKSAIDAGAQFIVSPGIPAQNVLSMCDSNGIRIIPGVETASEIIKMFEYGYRLLKYFPSNDIKRFRTVTAPFANQELTFIPTGGINATNQKEWLALSNVLCVGGSWITDNCNLETITMRAQLAIACRRGLEV